MSLSLHLCVRTFLLFILLLVRCMNVCGVCVFVCIFPFLPHSFYPLLEICLVCIYVKLCAQAATFYSSFTNVCIEVEETGATEHEHYLIRYTSHCCVWHKLQTTMNMEPVNWPEIIRILGYWTYCDAVFLHSVCSCLCGPRTRQWVIDPCTFPPYAKIQYAATVWNVFI